MAMIRDHVKEYFEMFYEIKGLDKGDKQAYFDTESAWVSKYGFQKYTSYESFRVMKYRYLRNLLTKLTQKVA
jgi:hypothetical protein